MYIGMTKSKSSASSVVVPSIFAIHLMSGVRFLNATRVALLCAVVKISPLTDV